MFFLNTVYAIFCYFCVSVYTDRHKRPFQAERSLAFRPWQGQWRQRDWVRSRGTFASPHTMTSLLRHTAWTSRASSRRATGREAGTCLARCLAGRRDGPEPDGWKLNRQTLAAKAGDGDTRKSRRYDEGLDRTRVWRHSLILEVTSVAEKSTLQNNKKLTRCQMYTKCQKTGMSNYCPLR